MITRPLAVLAASALLLSACRSTRPYTSAELRGRDLYTLHCYQCHNTPQPGLIKTPPSLHSLFAQPALPSGLSPATDDAVRAVIVHGRRTMPAFDGRLKSVQVDDLIAWLHRQ